MFRKQSEVQAHLQAIADQVGAKRFESAKNAYLANIVVTDDEGTPLAPGAFQFDISLQTEEKAATDTADAIEQVRKAVRDEIATATKSVQTKAPVIAAGDDLPRVKAFGKATHLRRVIGDQSKANDTAYAFGKFVQAAMGSQKAAAWLASNGMPMRKGHTEGDNERGGFLVPDQLDASIIDLRETYGVFRRNAYRLAMTGDTAYRRRRAGGLTAYAVGEASAITESTKTWNIVRLVAKKWGVLTTISNELNEDATINLGDDFAQEVAWAFSLKEDECGFVGDGTSTYHGIVGLSQAFTNLGTVSNSAGVVDGTGSTWSSLVLSDFNAMVGRLPVYARRNAKWYCSAAFFNGEMERLAYASGGVTVTDVKDGVPQQMFLGYPVEIAQVMPSASATGFSCYFGDLSAAAMFGDRRGTTIAFSDSALDVFEQDEIAARGTIRFDINVHDIGNNSATAANRVAGPIVALYIG